MIEIKIDANNSGGRLNKYLSKYLTAAPSSFIYKMLRKKNITLNETKADGSEILQTGDMIKLFLSDETIEKFRKVEAVNTKKTVPLAIIYEDDNVIFVNKPINKLSQPDGKDKDSLVYDIHGYLKTQHNATFKPAIANRLDRNTTGIVLCGKNLKALQSINKAIHDKHVDKYYVAMVHGQIKKSGVLKSYHKKDDIKNTVKLSNKEKDGIEIITEYAPIQIFSKYTYVRLKLVTGKSHQLRAHMASIGHPIVGDTKYLTSSSVKSPKKYSINSQMLHAHTVQFNQCQEPLEYLQGEKIIADLPKKFSLFLESLQPTLLNIGDKR